MSTKTLTRLISKTDNLLVIIDDEFYPVSNKHPDYAELKKAADEGDAEEFLRLFEDSVLDFSAGEKYEIKDKVKFTEESVTYRGRTITDPVVVKIVKSYGTTCDALKRFLDNLFLNPHWESVEQLGRFLEHNIFPLTEDGCFLGYKAINPNYRDIWSDTVDNSIGTTVVMPRADVTYDPNKACDAGLHVGTYDYAQGWARSDSLIVLVKVNPAHCVSVPYDCTSQKLRCSQYTVLGLCEDVMPLGMIYSTEGRAYEPHNYFADVRKESENRRRRPKYVPQYQQCDPDDECDDDDICCVCGEHLEDCCCDDDEYSEYFCENCVWCCEIDETDQLLGSISYCPSCGDEITLR